MTDDAATPTTAAGRYWLDQSLVSFKKRRTAILAIEAEARAAALRDTAGQQFDPTLYEPAVDDFGNQYLSPLRDAAGIDVERLALAVARAVIEAERRYPAGYSMTGDLVPIIAAEYDRLTEAQKKP